MCLCCEKTSHESKNFPLLSLPKHVAITYGENRNELIFHEVPASPEVTFKHDRGKVGEISVEGGTLSSQEIVNELAGTHQCDLQPKEGGAFKALFPSKADLARMAKIIGVTVLGTDIFLIFEEWSAAELDPFFLTKVWVRVYGVTRRDVIIYLFLLLVLLLESQTKLAWSLLKDIRR
jgi:hypothetical protein